MDRWAQEQLERLRQEGLLRQLRVNGTSAGRVAVVDGRQKVVFCSNNYLGLAHDPRIVAAAQEALDKWGLGSGASRLISGTMTPHERLEKHLAGLLGKEAAVVFPSGYMTNHAVLRTLGRKGDLIAMDKLVHASIIDGAQASAAEVRSWPHGQLGKLERLLERGGYARAMIVTDSLFSMDGDRAKLAELAAIKRRYGAVLVVDEAHALGCVGPEGQGVAAEAGVPGEVDIFVGTLSKALGGAGGFAACSRAVADYLINAARGFIFTTALPAVHCVAAQTALEVVAAEPQRRQRLSANGDYFRNRCKVLGLNTGDSESYIVPILLGSVAKATAVAEQLWQRGYWVPAIRPPTVKAGTSRLRVSLMSEHTQDDIDGLCEVLGEIFCH